VTTIESCLTEARSYLPHIEADTLTANALGVERSTIYAFPERRVSNSLATRHANWIDRRRRGEPVAYITGEREFWSIPLRVDDRVLIPRPETELLVEAALTHMKDEARVLDLGTGSGALAIAIAKTRPKSDVVGIDCDPQCLELARLNASRLRITISFQQSYWFSSVDDIFDVIVANPPYIAENDPHLKEGDVRFEPRTALTAGSDGLSDLRRIIEEAPNFLQNEGWLLVEHGRDHHELVQAMFREAKFHQIDTLKDLSMNPRVTLGQRS